MQNLLSMRNVLQFVIVVAVLGVAGCSGESAPYSEDIRTNYMEACIDNGGTATSCTCTLDYVEGHKTEAEYVRIEAKIALEGIVDDVIYDAIEACFVPSDKGAGLSGFDTTPTVDLKGEAASLAGFASVSGDSAYVAIQVPQSALTPSKDSADIITALADARENQVTLKDFLARVGTPAGTFKRMLGTNALSGTQEALGDGVLTTWSFHPTSGLQIVISQTGSQLDASREEPAAMPPTTRPSTTRPSTTTPADALGVFFASHGVVDNAAERTAAAELGLLMARIVSVADPDYVAACALTPELVMDVMLDDAPGDPAVVQTTTERDEFSLFAFASAEVYGGEVWAEFYANCG